MNTKCSHIRYTSKSQLVQSQLQKYFKLSSYWLLQSEFNGVNEQRIAPICQVANVKLDVKIRLLAMAVAASDEIVF